MYHLSLFRLCRSWYGVSECNTVKPLIFVDGDNLSTAAVSHLFSVNGFNVSVRSRAVCHMHDVLKGRVVSVTMSVKKKSGLRSCGEWINFKRKSEKR